MNHPLDVLILSNSREEARRLLRRLTVHGYTVRDGRLASAEEAAGAASEREWDLALLDLEGALSPDGAAEAATLKEAQPDLPFLFLARTFDSGQALAAIRLGAADLIAKDRLDRLVPAVDRSLREARVRRERRRAEEALRENERRLSTLMRNLPGMAYRMSRNTQEWELDFASDGALTLCGFHPDDFKEGKGFSFRDLVLPEDRKGLKARIEEALARGEPFQVLYRIRTRQGRVKWVWEQGMGVYSDAGAAIALEGFLADITDRKKAEDELKQTLVELASSRADLEQFAYVASHDLRAPLRAIGNLAQWIEEDLKDLLPEESRRNMDLLKNRVRRMEKMIDGILAYARADLQGVTLEEVSTEELVREVVDLLDPPRGFSVRTIGAFPRLRTARSPLQQVFANLIGNALRHHDRDEGTVTVEAREERGEVTMFILGHEAERILPVNVGILQDGNIQQRADEEIV